LGLVFRSRNHRTVFNLGYSTCRGAGGFFFGGFRELRVEFWISVFGVSKNPLLGELFGEFLGSVLNLCMEGAACFSSKNPIPDRFYNIWTILGLPGMLEDNVSQGDKCSQRESAT